MRKNVSSIGGLALLLAWSVFALPGYSLAADSGDSRIGALGILRPKGGVAVLAGPGGSTVAAVFVAQNDMVHKGQPLLRFSNGETAEAELTTIRLDQEELVGNNRNDLRLKDLDIAKAQTDLERTERSLANYQAIGQSAQVATIREDRENQVRDARHALKVRQAERDGMQARFQGALAKLENRRRIAQITLENTQLTAPFDGVVLDVRKQPGESSAGELLTLADISVMQVDADVFEGDLGKLRVGQTATVTSKSLLTQQTATVESVGRQINVDRKVAKVLLRMEKSDPAARYVGMEVNVSIQP